MVKAVQAEESISEYFDGLLKNRVQAEVGTTVISSLSLDRAQQSGCSRPMPVQLQSQWSGWWGLLLLLLQQCAACRYL
jgi:hypothetical protein